MQVGGGAGGGGLRGALLDVTQLSDRFGERGQPGDQHQRCEGRVLGEVGERGDQAGGGA
jgi:hypothetical protein